MNLISIDLGTTNIKVSVYDSALRLLSVYSENVSYDRTGDFVEFNCCHYFDLLFSMVHAAAAAGKSKNGQDAAQIVLTGQAESLVLIGKDGQPVRPAISWLDMRSKKECEELSGIFDKELCYHITGQPELIPTWPITKILWLRRNEPDIFDKTDKFLLLKDYIIYRLCGAIVGEQSIYSFSHYFNITKKCYWEDILSYCGINTDRLPEKILPSGTVAGTLISKLADPGAGLTSQTKINAGTLDHFAGMIGTGNIGDGVISESAGTVLSIAALINKPVFHESRLPMYCGPFPETYVLLPVCESGGFSMEWYKKNFLPDISYDQMNRVIESRKKAPAPIFLPYLTGVTPPEFNENASGVFLGLKAAHDRYDMALAIMEGVACLLKKNIEYMEKAGIHVHKIISTGGGAKSALWTQIKSDISGYPIDVPDNEEAPSLGAAILAAVSENYFSSCQEAAAACVSINRQYLPENSARYKSTYQVFTSLYDSLTDVYRMDAERTQNVS